MKIAQELPAPDLAAGSGHPSFSQETLDRVFANAIWPGFVLTVGAADGQHPSPPPRQKTPCTHTGCT
jgi:hypothetical protein